VGTFNPQAEIKDRKEISTCFTKPNHKYGIQVPHTIEEAFQLIKSQELIFGTKPS
jgi:hypothetical protein